MEPAATASDNAAPSVSQAVGLVDETGLQDFFLIVAFTDVRSYDVVV